MHGHQLVCGWILLRWFFSWEEEAARPGMCPHALGSESPPLLLAVTFAAGQG